MSSHSASVGQAAKMWSRNKWLLLLFITVLTNANGTYLNIEGLPWSDIEMVAKLQGYLKSPDRNVSEGCFKELAEYSQSLSTGKMWAVKMLDATSKISSGIITGNTGDMGAFDQCLEVEADTKVGSIHAAYCLGTLHIPEMKFEENVVTPKDVLFASCFPSSCSAEEVQDFYVKSGSPVELTDLFCQDKSDRPKLTTGIIIAMGVFGGVSAIMVVSTAYDVFLYYTKRKTAHVLLTAFSMKKNGETLLEVSTNPSHLLCLHGIRAISQMWIVLEHKYFGNFFSLGLTNRRHFAEWVEDPSSMFILGASVVVDTFLLMGGLVVSYAYLNARDKGRPFSVLKHYAHRYIRLTPALAAVVLFYAVLIEYSLSGPFAKLIGMYFGKPCEYLWWSALLYVQNYVNPLHTCAIQTWYLSVDMQLFLLSPLLLIPLYKRPKLALTAVGVLLFGTLLSPFLVAWFFQLRRRIFVNQTMTEPTDYTKYYYHPTHTRAAPWLMGFILGYIIFKIKKGELSIGMKKQYKQIIAFALWGLALAVGVACISSGHDLIVGEYDRLANTLHIGLVKPIWTLAVAWVILACVTGYGGPINRFLSHPIFHFLSKVSYGTFLVHIGVMAIAGLNRQTTTPFSNLAMVLGFLGEYLLSVFVATLWVLAFEYPWVTIDNFIFEDRKKDKSVQQPPKDNKRKGKIE